MQEIAFADIEFSYFFSFIFKVNHIFMAEKENPSEKVVIDGEELDGIKRDGVWNLEGPKCCEQ